MSESEEQADLPSRGWSDEGSLDQGEDDSLDQSER